MKRMVSSDRVDPCERTNASFSVSDNFTILKHCQLHLSVMTSSTPSDKLSELFQTFRDNENELEQLKQSARQKNQSVERTQQELLVVQDRVALMESEHRDLRKVLNVSKFIVDVSLCFAMSRCHRFWLKRRSTTVRLKRNFRRKKKDSTPHISNWSSWKVNTGVQSILISITNISNVLFLIEQKRHLEDVQLEQQLTFTKQLRQQSAEYTDRRRTDAGALRRGELIKYSQLCITVNYLRFMCVSFRVEIKSIVQPAVHENQ